MRTDAAETTESVADNSAEQAPAPRISKTLFFGTIGALLGVAVVLGSAWFLHLSSTRAMKEEIVLLKKQIAEREKALTEAQSQAANLSIQMKALREYAVARSSGSTPSREADSQTAVPPATAVPAETASNKETGEPKATASQGDGEKAKDDAKARTSPPGGSHGTEKKQKKAPTTCDLVGKSPEEQAAILKRCVELID